MAIFFSWLSIAVQLPCIDVGLHLPLVPHITVATTLEINLARLFTGKSTARYFCVAFRWNQQTDNPATELPSNLLLPLSVRLLSFEFNERRRYSHRRWQR